MLMVTLAGLLFVPLLLQAQYTSADWIRRLLDPDTLVLVLIFGGGMVVGLVGIIAHHWRRLRQTEIETEMKREMLNRGMSAEDVERVIKASASPADGEKTAARRRWE
jgi:hypothetical protein